MMKGKAFSFPERYSYARERLGSHLREPDGSQKTVAILSDVIAVIDEYISMTAYSSISAGTVVRGFDFLELAQHLNEQTALGLHAVRGAEAEIRLLKPVLAGLKKLVLIVDCKVREDEVPSDPEGVLALSGPSEVDAVTHYLLEKLAPSVKLAVTHDPIIERAGACCIVLAFLGGILVLGVVWGWIKHTVGHNLATIAFGLVGVTLLFASYVFGEVEAGRGDKTPASKLARKLLGGG